MKKRHLYRLLQHIPVNYRPNRSLRREHERVVIVKETKDVLNCFLIYSKMRHINMGGKGTQNTAAHMFRLDLKDCCTCVPMTVGLLHGSKTNAPENFLFNGLFKTPKFDLDQKLCCFY